MTRELRPLEMVLLSPSSPFTFERLTVLIDLDNGSTQHCSSLVRDEDRCIRQVSGLSNARTHWQELFSDDQSP